jgi:hypothetical protein
MKPSTSLRALTAATPLALFALLASTPQASAEIGGTALNNARVLGHGATLGVVFTSAVSNDATDNANARKAASALAGNWVGGLVDYALRNTPPHVSTCRLTTTVTDPNGATGTASAIVPAGVANNVLDVPDQTPGTTWGVGDFDHFDSQFACTDAQSGSQLSKVIIAQDATAA